MRRLALLLRQWQYIRIQCTGVVDTGSEYIAIVLAAMPASSWSIWCPIHVFGQGSRVIFLLLPMSPSLIVYNGGSRKMSNFYVKRYNIMLFPRAFLNYLLSKQLFHLCTNFVSTVSSTLSGNSSTINGV